MTTMFLVTLFVVALFGVESWWVLLVESQCFVLLCQWCECSPFSFVAILGLLLAWLFHPITRGAYALPVVELATSFTPCSICWRQ